MASRQFILMVVFLIACNGRDSASSTTSANVEPAARVDTKTTDRESQVKSATRTADLLLIDAYKSDASRLVDSLQKEGIDDATLRKMASSILVQGYKIMGAALKVHPECLSYFTALNLLKKQLSTIDIDTLERDFHKGGALPKNKNQSCYHVKDLVVHPATVLVGLRADVAMKKVDMTREIVEVLGHLHEVKALFKEN